MTEKTSDFWQDHSERYLEMAFRADRRGSIAHPDGYGKHTGECGDTVEIFLSVRDNRIESVMFQMNGCLNTSACANAVAQLAEGCVVAEAWEIRPETVIETLQTLPSDHYHCAELVVGAFYRALADHNELQRRPWKKNYRTR
ncbi:MAG: nitrogen fixation protein NifU [Deltaproteobacteria bacterium SG8_13]|nr:MAG: nitrogen fixation protein NifU [Deltaproteobacteria bacterium SG8_13]